MSDSRRKRESSEDDAPSRKVARTSENTPWPRQLHESLVSAIYEVGMKNSSPSVILEQMVTESPALTSERIKSHLQKYRASREKSKQEFMDSYNSWLDKTRGLPPSVVASKDLLGGESAAYLSYCTMMMDSMPPPPSPAGNFDSLVSSQGAADGRGRLDFPKLTEWEQRTPLGEAMRQVSGLLVTMTKQLTRERLKKEQHHLQLAQQQQLALGQQQQQQQQGAILINPMSIVSQGSSQQDSSAPPENATQKKYEL